MKPSINNLESLAKCPICNKNYGQTNILVLEDSDRKKTLHVTCRSCNVSSLVFISSGKMGIVSLGMLTDLTTEEARLIFKGEAVSTDQVIDVHEYLKNTKEVNEFI